MITINCYHLINEPKVTPNGRDYVAELYKP